MTAYILNHVQPEKVREVVVRAEFEMEGTRHVDACWVVSDVFAEAETLNDRKLHELVIDQVQKLKGVERTSTHIAVE